MVLVAIFGGAFNSIAQNIAPSSIDLQLRTLDEERKQIQAQMGVGQGPEAEVLNNVRLSLNQLTEYYTINKAQARSSFQFSVYAIVAGLTTVIMGIWLFYFQAKSIQLTSISTLAGLLVQFIGGAYFYLYNRTVTQLNYYFNTLVTTQETMLAIFLCGQLSPDDQTVARVNIINALISRVLASRAPFASDYPAIGAGRESRPQTSDGDATIAQSKIGAAKP